MSASNSVSWRYIAEVTFGTTPSTQDTVRALADAGEPEGLAAEREGREPTQRVAAKAPDVEHVVLANYRPDAVVRPLVF